MMQSDSNFKQAISISYRLLSYRQRSVYEVSSKLKEKGYDRDLIDRVIDHLKRLHYLDDKEFAKLWVESRMRYKPVGSIGMKRDLKSKGLEEGLINEAIRTKETRYDDFETALKIAERRLATCGKIHKLKAKRRIYDYLVRMGFKFEIARQVLKELFKK